MVILIHDSDACIPLFAGIDIEKARRIELSYTAAYCHIAVLSYRECRDTVQRGLIDIESVLVLHALQIRYRRIIEQSK